MQRTFLATIVLLLNVGPMVAGDFSQKLSRQIAIAEAACAAPRELLANKLEPEAARLWKELEALAGPATAMKGAEQEVRALAAELQAQSPASFAALEEFRRYDQRMHQLTAARRKLELAQAQRRAEVRRLAAQSADGRQGLAELAEVETQIVDAQRQLRTATARLTTAQTRLKFYTAPPPPPGLIAGDGSPLKLQPPADAAQRRERFAARNSPESIAALAKEFFARVDLDTPGLEQAKALYAAGKHAAALAAWRDAFLARLRDPQQHGLPANWGGDLDTASLLRRPEQKKLDAAMENIFSTPRATAVVGPPGTINWGDPGPDPSADALRNPYLDFYTMRGQAGFVDVLGPHLVLLEGYAATGERKYLDRWAEVLDDWAMNAPADMERSPFAIRQYPVLCSFRPVALASTLTDVLEAQPDFARDLPAPTLARIMLAVMEEYPASFVRLARRGIYNWRCIAMTGAVLTAQAFPEFRVAEWQLDEAKRLMELNWSHKILRDGGNLEQGNWGHEPNDQVHLGRAIELLETNPPAWMTSAWRDEWRGNMQLNARYFLQTLKPDGYTYKFSRVSTADKLSPKGRLPGERWPIQANLLLAEPEARRRIDWVHGSGTQSPEVMSESLAYFGAAVLRGGWEPDAAFLYFQSSPNRDCGGREDANGFALHAYGHALLLAPPLAVDDRTQNIHHGLVRDPGGKTVYLTYDKRRRPVDARFHASPRYDFTEGIYRGVYQFHQGPSADIFGEYGYLKIAEARQKAGERDEPIRDVTHAREVLSLRGEDLVIVADRWTSDGERKFSQNYTLFTPVDREGWKQRIELAQKANRPPLAIDAATRTLRTDNQALPSASVRHFGAGEPKYTHTHNAFDHLGDAETADQALATLGSNKLKKWTLGLPLPFHHKVRADWQTRGPQVLVTAIAQRPANYGDEPFAGDLRDVQAIDRNGIVGFRATTRRDARVTYLTSINPSKIAAGEVEIVGDSLLVVERAGQPMTGLALGASQVTCSGVPHKSSRDFEFSVDDGKLTTTPIYRPIQPVEISPAAHAFIDAQQVELKCNTPGVEIRYTLDGSDPTHASPLYHKPVTIRETTRVKARAFRPGMTATPWSADGTHATDVSLAIYEKQSPLPAVDLADAQPGLAWEYLPGRWPQLFVDAERLAATKRGTSAKLIDVSMRDTDGAFTVRASGFLHVPADGVYTLHAPAEWIYPDNECGYDLQVDVHDRRWQPATRRHGHGTWSLALKQGAHPLQVVFTDFRARPVKRELWDGFPHPDIVWQGEVPELQLSGPGLAPIAIPASWLSHATSD